MNIIKLKLKGVLFSVMPIVLLVLFIHLFIVKIHNNLLIRFGIGSILIILGLTLFLFGVDLTITPLGKLTGNVLAKSNRVLIVILGSFLIGFFISLAEPGLLVLANQVNNVTNGLVSSWLILLVVSIGLAVLLAFGFLRIFLTISLKWLLFIIYSFIFCLSLFSSPEFLAISFDASGATTGILAVPFILSLSAGVSRLKKDSLAGEEDSFGLVAIASSGAIMSVLLVDILFNLSSFSQVLTLDPINFIDIGAIFINHISDYIFESFTSFLPLVIIFGLLVTFWTQLKKREFRKMITGFIFGFIGLFLFVAGVNGGFMDVGIYLGSNLVLLDNKLIVLLFSFLLGVLTILAEPAVYVLTNQIEDVTSGYVKKMAVLVSLSIGVGIAIFISMLRIIIVDIELWHYLLPGYLLCFVLMFFCPKLFVAIAFDAGGVATGPMTATFILAFIQGSANSLEHADLLVDGFGMISIVALMPIITLQILGIIFSYLKKRRDLRYE